MIKKALLRLTLYAIIIYLTVGTLNPAVAATHPLARNGTHFCGVTDGWANKRYSDQYPNRRYARTAAANLNVGEPRTVRMIYFLPNDRPYRADVVQRMKDEILNIQAFYAEQMEAHGYGRRTFRVETDPQGEPKVHRVDGQQPNSDYQRGNHGNWLSDIEQAGFDITANVYFIVMDLINDEGGFGGRWGKNGGEARLLGNVWFTVAAHELGHAFGLHHDFHDDTYIMSYGGEQRRSLSACHAEFLSVHPYFNPNISTREDDPPTIELISSTRYTAGTKRVPVRLKISGSARLHQAILFATTVPTTGRYSITAGLPEVKVCYGLVGNRDTVVEFDYDGVIPSDSFTSLSDPVVHPMGVNVVDTDGNVGSTDFVLFSEALEPLTKISGDNLQGLPNTPLLAPFIVEVRDLNDGFPRYEVWVTFTVTAGGGTLSAERVKTDKAGRAESTLTLGPNLGTNTVEVYAEGHTATFNAVAGGAVDIPDPNLRAAIKNALGKAPGTPIAPAEMATLTRLAERNANISNLTGLKSATNLTTLDLDENNITDISPMVGLTNLTWLLLGGNNISDISVLARLTNLTGLSLYNNNISDISVLARLTNLTQLWLAGNNISNLLPLVDNKGLRSGDTVDVRGNPLSYESIHTHIPKLQAKGVDIKFDNVIVEPVNIPDTNLRAKIEEALGKAPGTAITSADMANLTGLNAREADISSLTGLEHATNLTSLNLAYNNIPNISPVVGLTKLTALYLSGNKIEDLRPVMGLTKLTALGLGSNSISNISPLTDLTELNWLALESNQIEDIGQLAGLTKLTRLRLWNNSIFDISALAGLTQLTELGLKNNSISDISLLTELTNLEWLSLQNNNISDLSPLVANTGLGSGDTVDVSENPLNYQSIHTHIPDLQSRGVEVQFANLKPVILEYTLSIPPGISLIHVPLRVTAVKGVETTVASISDLYDVLGGANAVQFLITYDSEAQDWHSYFGASDTSADVRLANDTGIIANLKAPASLHLSGTPLRTGGSGAINLEQGLNLVGLPLRDPRIQRVSDLFTLDGIDGNVPVIILTDNGEFNSVGRAGDPGDIAITGGQGFIMTAQRAATVTLSGDGWYNAAGTSAAPQVALKGIEVKNTTPVLALRGAVVDKGAGLKVPTFRVTVKNLSTGRAVATAATPNEAGYQLTVVDIETGRAATVGDILEISAQSPDPSVGIQPLRYTVTAEDVKRSYIQLPDLVAYEIPSETELLSNYPNPFNPETWIPYRLAEDAFVTLTIYDGSGKVVRALDVGHRIAAVYENRSKAIYWDGRNDVGERVASGVYFYHLSTSDYSATRRMVILK